MSIRQIKQPNVSHISIKFLKNSLISLKYNKLLVLSANLVTSPASLVNISVPVLPTTICTHSNKKGPHGKSTSTKRNSKMNCNSQLEIKLKRGYRKLTQKKQ